tara:strand:- start:155 stop:838 length:684 start_codon:yes stop_codon:yes gene_type:complete
MIKNYLSKKIFNNDLNFHKSGFLLIKQTNTIVIADIHLGKGTSLNKNGIQVPPYDIKETLQRLNDIVDEYNPSKVISLGDSFHDKFSIINMEKSDLNELKKITKRVNFFWINGNHDQDLIGKDKIGGIFFDSYKENNFYFRHIKTKNKTNSYQFSGHFHPKVSIKINNSRFFYKCFIVSKDFCILPSFGYYTGGLDVYSKDFRAIINEAAEIIILGKKKILLKKYRI